MEENLDIIEIEGKEYAICESFNVNEKQYWIISELLSDDSVSEEVAVVRVEGGLVYSIEDEEEQKAVKKEIDRLLEETE